MIEDLENQKNLDDSIEILTDDFSIEEVIKRILEIEMEYRHRIEN